MQVAHARSSSQHSHAPPDPDAYYTPSSVAHMTGSPEVEVYGHNINVVQRGIQRRQAAAVSRLEEKEAARVRPPRVPPSVSHSKHKANTPPPVPQDTDFELLTKHDMQMHKQRMNYKVLQHPFKVGEKPPCFFKRCPFCTGPLVLQRYTLM